MSGQLVWTTVTAYSVRVGDPGHVEDHRGLPQLQAGRDMVNTRNGKRLLLADGATCALPKTGTLRAYAQPPQ